MSCGCTDPCQPNSIPCTCEARVTSDCVTVSGATSDCLAIGDNLLLTDYLTQMDERICEKVDSITNFIALENVGTGSQLYKGDSLLGKKQIRTVKSIDPNLVVTETADEIQLDLNIPTSDGTETKLVSGTNTTVVGNGSVATPYSVNVAFPTPPDGSETKVIAGTNTTVTGLGTTASPYVVNSTDTIADGSETKVVAGTNTTITGNGTDATPYIINSSATGGQEVLEKVDEGSGLGIIIKGRVSGNYGNIGLRAVDLSFAEDSNSPWGATATDTFTSGYHTIASADNSTATGFYTRATNFNSNASGQNTEASGEASNARNNSTTASGQFSDSSGLGTSAIGVASNSGGYNTIARGNYSSANGEENEANSIAEFVAGSFGTIITGNSANHIATDRIFNIGVGTNIENRRDGIALFKNGLCTLPSVTNALITSASGKAIITKEYLEASNNLQKQITTNTTLSNSDNNYTIFINNGATPITITIDSSVTLANFGVGFIQEGTGDVTFVGSGVSLTNPIGLKSKGQGYATFIERKLNTSNYFLLGDTKI